MGNLIIEIPQPQIYINVLLRLITCFIFLLYIIPLQIKEAGVKNGLMTLRRELLVTGILLFFINTLGLTIILVRSFFGDNAARLITEIVTVFNSVGLFTVALIKYQIYHQQYTPENKEKHARIYELEQQEDRR